MVARVSVASSRAGIIITTETLAATLAVPTVAMEEIEMVLFSSSCSTPNLSLQRTAALRASAAELMIR
jgi:hypothetical protein